MPTTAVSVRWITIDSEIRSSRSCAWKIMYQVRAIASTATPKPTITTAARASAVKSPSCEISTASRAGRRRSPS